MSKGVKEGLEKVKGRGKGVECKEKRKEKKEKRERERRRGRRIAHKIQFKSMDDDNGTTTHAMTKGIYGVSEMNCLK